MDVDITLSSTATRSDDAVTVRLAVTVPEGCYVYTPAADDGKPMHVTLPESSPFELTEPVQYPATDDGHAAGSFEVTVELAGGRDEAEVELIFGYQVCEENTCFMPTKRTVTTKIG